MNESLLNGSALLALGAIMMNLIAVKKLHKQQLKRITSSLLLFTMLRYITLMIYGGAPSLQALQAARYFYFASSLGLTMTTVLAIWYAMPCLREKFSASQVVLFFSPWILFYLYVIIGQPTEIVRGRSYGYVLTLTGRWPMYLSIAQGSLIVIIVLVCIYGIMRYKHLQIRVQLFFIVCAQVLLALDGMSYRLSTMQVFPPFTLSEAFGFAATYYTFGHALRAIGGGKRA